jgi:hypothetical protein
MKRKKLIVSGSRKWVDRLAIRTELESVIDPDEDWLLIEGGAEGADTIARHTAWDMGVPTATMKANWPFYGTKAGPIRNYWMLDLEPDLVLAFPLPESVGTRHMIHAAQARGVEVRVYDPEGIL